MILGHIGLGLVIKSKFRQIHLIPILIFSILPEVLLPGLIYSLIFPGLVRQLGLIEFSMRCATSFILIGILALLTILISKLIKNIKLGYVLSLCLFTCVLSNFFVEAYWFFPVSNLNYGLGIYPWKLIFWIIDIPVFSFCLIYYLKNR